MKKKIFFYLITVLLTSFLIFLIYISFNSNFRRNFLSISMGAIKTYYSASINSSLKSTKPDTRAATDKLKRLIGVSDYITSDGKNSFLNSIYESAYLIEEKISDNDDYLYFYKIVDDLIKKDPDIYNARIWYAKTLIIKGEESKKIFSELNKAINLFPAFSEAYRVGINYALKTNQLNTLNEYCKRYHSSSLGGKTKQFVSSNFYGVSLSKFALETLPTSENKKYYIMEGLTLNQILDYDFSFDGSKNIDGINIYSNFFEGIKIEIEDITVFNTDNSILKILPTEIYATSKNAYMKNSNDNLTFYINSEKNQKLTINFNKKYQDISKIKLKIKFSKLNLTNKPNC